MRVPTRDGDVWFKENPAPTAFEPALTQLLWRRRNDAVPEVVAHEGARMLTRDQGERLRALLDGGAREPEWDDLLRLYAELQIELAAEADTALALETPDARLHRVPSIAEALTDDAVLLLAVKSAAARLAETVPPTVVHMEAHDGNIFVRDGRPVFIDWAEAVVTHPFVGPLLPLRSATERLGYAPGSPEVERLRDVYLEPFTQFVPMADLRRLFWDGYLLAPICRAQMWREVLDPLGPAQASAHGDPVGGWLGVLRELVERETLFGGA